MSINGLESKYVAGDIITVLQNKKHSFRTIRGVIFEEVSTTDYCDDSYYTDNVISKNKTRKTNLKEWWIQF